MSFTAVISYIVQEHRLHTIWNKAWIFESQTWLWKMPTGFWGEWNSISCRSVKNEECLFKQGTYLAYFYLFLLCQHPLKSSTSSMQNVVLNHSHLPFWVNEYLHMIEEVEIFNLGKHQILVSLLEYKLSKYCTHFLYKMWLPSKRYFLWGLCLD